MQQSMSRRGRADGRSPTPSCRSSAAHDAAANPEPVFMTTFRIRLVERITNQGSADFQVEAQSAEEAATIVAQAQLQAHTAGSNIVILPDGQVQIVESEGEVGRELVLILLNDDGIEVRTIPLPPSLTQLQ
jgi:hypothetical protein